MIMTWVTPFQFRVGSIRIKHLYHIILLKGFSWLTWCFQSSLYLSLKEKYDNIFSLFRTFQIHKCFIQIHFIFTISITCSQSWIKQFWHLLDSSYIGCKTILLACLFKFCKVAILKNMQFHTFCWNSPKS